MLAVGSSWCSYGLFLLTRSIDSFLAVLFIEEIIIVCASQYELEAPLNKTCSFLLLFFLFANRYHLTSRPPSVVEMRISFLKIEDFISLLSTVVVQISGN